MTAPQPPAAPGAPADAGTGGQAPTGTQPTTTPPAPGSGTQSPAKTDLNTLPDDVRKIIEDARAEAARHRTDKQTAAQAAAEAKAQRDAVLKALNLKPDGTEDVDPNKLTEQVNQYKAVAWENAVEAQVVRLAGTVGFDADALLDSNKFLDSLGDLVTQDPNSGDFRALLEAHLKKFVADNPKFKAAAAGPKAPASSGGVVPPGQPGGVTTRPTSLSAAVSKALGGG